VRLIDRRPRQAGWLAGGSGGAGFQFGEHLGDPAAKKIAHFGEFREVVERVAQFVLVVGELPGSPGMQGMSWLVSLHGSRPC
jgi:hypothetical protein